MYYTVMHWIEMGEGAERWGEGLSFLKLNPADFIDMKEKKASVSYRLHYGHKLISGIF